MISSKKDHARLFAALAKKAEALRAVRVNGKVKKVPSGKFTLWSLHPTKGWRHSSIGESEKDHAITVQKYPLLREWPKSVFVRSAA